MYEFYGKHDKPIFQEDIGMTNFKSSSFWNKIVSQIPPIIRKLAEYYQIPTSQYPQVEVIFNDNKWENWRTVFGKRYELETITGGVYSPIRNRIALNPYLYLFEGGQEFLSVMYHELAHWIIQHVDYLNEEVADKEGKKQHHLLDFNMVLNDIYDLSTKKYNHWDNYRDLKTVKDENGDEIYKHTDNMQTLELIFIRQVSKGSEYYEGVYSPIDGDFCYSFDID